MALSYATAQRNSRLQVISDAIDGGVAAGKLKLIASGSTTVAVLTFSDPCALSITSGVLTFNTITADTSAPASGTAVTLQCTTSADAVIVTGTVGTSGTDLVLNNNVITAGDNVSVSSFTITENNP